jgi:hypothetical protein
MMALLPFKVRIEAWEKNGLNCGWVAHDIAGNDPEVALQEARMMYQKYFHGKDKQVTIRHKDEIIWKFYKGKVTEYDGFRKDTANV